MLTASEAVTMVVVRCADFLHRRQLILEIGYFVACT